MNGDKGFTYPAALLLIVVVSTSLMVVQKQWSTIMKREKEQELFFRAEQILYAIESYYQKSPGDKLYPPNFKVLLKDNRFPGTIRHLRKWYKDPLTADGEWGIVYDGRGRMKGVYSRSSDEPIKKGNFSEHYKSFENKKKYSQWKFIYEEKKEAAS